MDHAVSVLSIAGRGTSRATAVRLQSLVTHATFGRGLCIAGVVLTLLSGE